MRAGPVHHRSLMVSTTRRPGLSVPGRSSSFGGIRLRCCHRCCNSPSHIRMAGKARSRGKRRTSHLSCACRVDRHKSAHGLCRCCPVCAHTSVFITLSLSIGARNRRRPSRLKGCDAVWRRDDPADARGLIAPMAWWPLLLGGYYELHPRPTFHFEPVQYPYTAKRNAYWLATKIAVLISRPLAVLLYLRTKCLDCSAQRIIRWQFRDDQLIGGRNLLLSFIDSSDLD